MRVTIVFPARILVWAPELLADKTILLAARADKEEWDRFVDPILEGGPVTYDEPGFSWRTQPDYHGLFVWVGSLEIEHDAIFFDGDWQNPTPLDLSHMAGLNIQQIGHDHVRA